MRYRLVPTPRGPMVIFYNPNLSPAENLNRAFKKHLRVFERNVKSHLAWEASEARGHFSRPLPETSELITGSDRFLAEFFKTLCIVVGLTAGMWYFWPQDSGFRRDGLGKDRD